MLVYVGTGWNVCGQIFKGLLWIENCELNHYIKL
jgi:hypothetical protein